MLKNAFLVLNFNKGVIRCDKCRDRVDFTDLEGLRLHQCPNCNTPLFIPKKIRSYWLYKPLGAGGFGSVYKAISSKSFRQYAVKVLPRACKDDEEYINALMFEASVGTVLGKNPHLVRTVEYGQEGDEYFMVNDFVEGERLDHLLQNLGRIPELLAHKMIMQILDTEQYIFNQGFLYRDLKPENILVDRNGHVTLLDYGLCCTVEDAQEGKTLSDHFEGSPHFIPPERIVGSPEGQYSEIYSIGMLFYNMLCANTFYKPSGGIKRLILQHVKSARLPSVKYNLTHCHKMTNKIIDRMIARSPRERFKDYQTLKRVLKHNYHRIKHSKYTEKISTFRQYTEPLTNHA